MKTSGTISYDLDFAGAPLPVLPRLILATAAVPESSSLAQVIRGIHGACSCNGAPSLAPSCSSRCSTFCRRSPCSHRRDGRNRADRFVCQAYDGLQEFIQRTACRSCRFTDNALGCRRLAHKNSTPSVHPSHVRVVRRRRDFRSNRRLRRSCNIGSAECDYGCGVASGVTHPLSPARSKWPSRRHGSYSRFGPEKRRTVYRAVERSRRSPSATSEAFRSVCACHMDNPIVASTRHLGRAMDCSKPRSCR